MKYDYLYRYTSDGEGIFSASRRLLPEHLADEVSNAMKWLPEPELPPSDDYRLYFTLKGKEQYEKTLFSLHKKYLEAIRLEHVPFTVVQTIGKVVYEDNWQVVIKKSETTDNTGCRLRFRA